jgi:hypothetical protein
VDAALIDGDHDQPRVGRREVAAEEGFDLVLDLPARLFDVDLEQLRRHDASLLAVDLDRELRSAKILDRPTAPVDDRDVDGNEVDARSEGRRLRFLRRKRGGGERDHQQYPHPRILLLLAHRW